MTTRRVNNKVRLAGQIVYIRFFDKTATVVVNTGLSEDGIHSNYPRAVVFYIFLSVAHGFKVGDYVLIDATMQDNRANANLPPRTIAVNHMVRLNPESSEYHTANRFDFWCHVINIQKVSDNKAKATAVIYTGQLNYITIYYEAEPEKIDEFCEINNKNYVHLTGQIRTNRVLTSEGKIEFFDKLLVSDFRVVK